MDSHFQYRCRVLGVAGAFEISHLQELQNRAASIVINNRYATSSNTLIKQLGWKTIDEMIQYESRVIMYKFVHGLAQRYRHDLTIRNIKNPSYELLNTAPDPQIPKRNSANDQKGFSFRGAKLWNSLSTGINSALAIIKLKKSI